MASPMCWRNTMLLAFVAFAQVALAAAGKAVSGSYLRLQKHNMLAKHKSDECASLACPMGRPDCSSGMMPAAVQSFSNSHIERRALLPII